MNNADMPAMPIFDGEGFPTMDGYLEGNRDPKALGLTKREHFAGLAMQAIIIGNNADLCALGAGAAKDAIQAADALLAELSKSGE